jgi:hypothetical protein
MRDSGFDQVYEATLQDVHDELLERRRPLASVPERVLRSAKPTIKTTTVLTVGYSIHADDAFLF